MKNTTKASPCDRGLPIFRNALRLKYFALAGAVLLLLTSNCGSGSEEPPGVTANGDDPDRVPTERVILGTGWQLHEEGPDPLTDTVVHSLSSEVPNLQNDGPSLRFSMKCAEGSDFQDFRPANVGVRFSEIVDFWDSRSRTSVSLSGFGRMTRAEIRWDREDAGIQVFWYGRYGSVKRGGLYTGAGPFPPGGSLGTVGPTYSKSNELVEQEAIDGMQRFLEKMNTHDAILLRFYIDDYPFLDYRFHLENFTDRVEDLREKCWGLTADD